jgi:hypothetical protein
VCVGKRIRSWKRGCERGRERVGVMLKCMKPIAAPIIEDVSRLVDITAGGNLLGLCDQTSSFKHVSDF